MNDIALVICLEKNKKIIDENNIGKFLYYENEAIYAVTSWRKNAGWLKDIKIYAVYSSDISKQTINKLKCLDVEIIRIKPFDNQEKYLFINTIFIQNYIHKVIKENILIYIDLDLYCLKPIPENLINISYSRDVLCYYDNNKNDTKEFDYRFKNINSLGGICYNTYFMITNRNTKLFERIINLIDDEEYLVFWKKFGLFKPTLDDYFFEEMLYDFVWLNDFEYRKKMYNIPVSQIENVLFRHRHLSVHDVVSNTLYF